MYRMTNQVRISELTQGKGRKNKSYRNLNCSGLRPPVQELKFTSGDIWTFGNEESTAAYSQTRVYHVNGEGDRSIRSNNISHSAISFTPKWRRKSLQTKIAYATMPRNELSEPHTSGWLQKYERRWQLNTSCKFCCFSMMRSNFATLSLTDQKKESPRTPKIRHISTNGLAMLRRSISTTHYLDKTKALGHSEEKYKIENKVTPYPVDIGKTGFVPEKPVHNLAAASRPLSLNGNPANSLNISNYGSLRFRNSVDAYKVHPSRAKSINAGPPIKSLSGRRSLIQKPYFMAVNEDVTWNLTINANGTHLPVTLPSVASSHQSNGSSNDTKVENSSVDAHSGFAVETVLVDSGEEKRKQNEVFSFASKHFQDFKAQLRGLSTISRQAEYHAEVCYVIPSPNSPSVKMNNKYSHSDGKDVSSLEDLTKEEKAPYKMKMPSSDEEKLWNLEENSNSGIMNDSTTARMVMGKILENELDVLTELIGKLSIENSSEIDGRRHCECLNSAKLKDRIILSESFHIEQPRHTSPLNIATERHEVVANAEDAESLLEEAEGGCIFSGHAQIDLESNSPDEDNEQDVKVSKENHQQYLSKKAERLVTARIIINKPFAKQSTMQPVRSVNIGNLETARFLTDANSNLLTTEGAHKIHKLASNNCEISAPAAECRNSPRIQALLQFNPLIYTLYPYSASDMTDVFNEGKATDFYTEEEKSSPIIMSNVELCDASVGPFSAAEKKRMQCIDKPVINSDQINDYGGESRPRTNKRQASTVLTCHDTPKRPYFDYSTLVLMTEKGSVLNPLSCSV